MANIFGILTTVVLIVALFVASKNKSRYEDEIVNVIAEKGRLSVSQDRLSTAQARLADIEAEIPVVRERTEELVAEGTEQRTANTRLESDIETKSNQASRNRDQISQLQETIDSFGNLDQLAQNLRNLQAELAELEHADDGIPARIEEVERLSSLATQIEAENTTTAAVLDGYGRGESRPGMTTRIRSLYPTWGFVTLADGGVSGIAGNATMDVVRNDQIIAKLQVTAVEPNSATATIIPGSQAEDVVLVPGDMVIPGTSGNGN